MVSHVVLICIFLLTNYVEHVFMCLFSICVSQGKCYSNILPCWVVWLLIIELLVLSYLGYNSFIRYTFACIISQSVACLFIFEQCWRAKLIILMKLNLDFFLYYLCFLFLSKKLCLTQGCKDYLLWTLHSFTDVGLLLDQLSISGWFLHIMYINMVSLRKIFNTVMNLVN